ncbi:MAG: hypothetical protein WA160_07030 [Pseudobdellovibrio sp.]
MKLIINLLVILFSIHAYCEIPEGVYVELQKFKSDNNLMLPNNYIQAFPALIEKIVSNSEEQHLTSVEKSCLDTIDVVYINKILNNSDSAAIDFESGLVRIEATKCFRNTSAKRILDISSDINFRLKAFTTIKKNTAKDDQICETTSAFSVGESNYCYQNNFESEANLYFKLTSFNIWNDNVGKYNSPVYFRYISETATQISTDAIYHMVTYVRGPKLSSFQRIFAKSFIKKTQADVFQKLVEELQNMK